MNLVHSGQHGFPNLLLRCDDVVVLVRVGVDIIEAPGLYSTPADLGDLVETGRACGVWPLRPRPACHVQGASTTITNQNFVRWDDETADHGRPRVSGSTIAPYVRADRKLASR